MSGTIAPFSMSTSLLQVAAATTSSDRLALTGYRPGASIVLKNLDLANDVRVAFGDSTVAVVAAAGAGRGYTIMARTAEVLTPTGTPTHMAFISAAGTATLEFCVGAGS